MSTRDLISVDHQTRIDFFPSGKGEVNFPDLNGIIRYLVREGYNTIKVDFRGVDKTRYVHFDGERVHSHATKRSLRGALSEEYDGVWAESREWDDRTLFCIQDKNRIRTHVSKEECLAYLDSLEWRSRIKSAFLRGMVLLSELFGSGAMVPLFWERTSAQQISEFALSSQWVGNQSFASGVGLPGGNWTALWNEEGGFISGETYSNSSSSSFEIQPSLNPLIQSPSFPQLASFPEGGFVVAVKSIRVETGFAPHFYERYNTTSQRTGLPVEIVAQGSEVDIAGLAGGRVVAVYRCSQGVCFKLFRSDDTVERDVLFTICDGDGPKVAALNSGNFVFAYACDDPRYSSFDIFIASYQADGSPFINGGVPTNSDTQNSQRFPMLAPLKNGGAILTWVSYLPGQPQFEIRGRRLDTNGFATGQEFSIRSGINGFCYSHSVVGLEDGGWLEVWVDQDADGSGIFALRFDSIGNTVGTVFPVNTYTIGEQHSPKAIALSDGGWVILWTSMGQDGDGAGVYGLRYNSAGEPMPAGDLASTLSSVTLLNPITSTSDQPVSIGSSQAAASSDRISEPEEDTTEPAVNTGFSQQLLLIEVIYGQTYPIYNAQGAVIAAFSITGGDGIYNSNNPGTLTITLRDGYVPQDGDTLTLFSLTEQVSWEDFVVEGTETRCLEAHGQSQGDDYQVIFSPTGCDMPGATAVYRSMVARAAFLSAVN